MDIPYSRKEFKMLPTDFKIGAILSDGVWYSHTKIKKQTGVTEEELNEWIDKHLATGQLVKASGGAESYRFPLESVIEWHANNNFHIGDQIVDFNLPARIWNGMTETEGFLDAPLREVGIVTFSGEPDVVLAVKKALRGIARVRETSTGVYKAYALDAQYVKSIVKGVFEEMDRKPSKNIQARGESKKREMSDFPVEFSTNLLKFYSSWGKVLVRPTMETIRIFIPEEEEQEAQILMWVIEAIEKFDESATVPFPGYLGGVLPKWPYNLPTEFLGKELSDFQKFRSRALKSLKKDGVPDEHINNVRLADLMGMDLQKFNDLEEKHRVWMKMNSATTLTWDENADEKPVENSDITSPISVKEKKNLLLANKMSFAIISAALSTGCFDDALFLISQADNPDLDLTTISKMSPEFVGALGELMGVRNG